MPQANILVVEDDPTIAIDIRFNLEDNGFVVIDTIHRAEEATEILDKNRIDRIMLDINLEGEMTGVDLAEIIHRDYHIPFIFLTSYSDESTLEKASHTYPAGYIVKPFKENDLAPAIRMALARQQTNGKNAFPSIDKLNKSLINKITATEYNIIKEVWLGKSNLEIASHLFVSKNTLKTHIRNIYSKLDVHSKPELISWLRG